MGRDVAKRDTSTHQKKNQTLNISRSYEGKFRATLYYMKKGIKKQ